MSMKLKTFFLIHLYVFAAIFAARMLVVWADPALYVSCRFCMKLEDKLGLIKRCKSHSHGSMECDEYE